MAAARWGSWARLLTRCADVEIFKRVNDRKDATLQQLDRVAHAAICTQVFQLLGEGSVIGVIPAALEPREVSGGAVGEVRIVPDMHTRKVRPRACHTIGKVVVHPPVKTPRLGC